MNDVRVMEEQSAEKSEELNLWRSLMDHPAWQKLVKIAEIQNAGRLAPRPLKSLDEALEMQFMQGEASGIQLLLKMPELQVEMAMRDLTIIQKEIDSAKSIEQYRMDGADGGRGSAWERRTSGWGSTHASADGVLDPRNDAFGSIPGDGDTTH